MFLNWTSSVNQETIKTGSLTEAQYISTYTYEDIMKSHIWNLYSSLTSSGWGFVSASRFESDQFTTSSNFWSNIGSIKFPSRMYDIEENTLITKNLEERKNIQYDPEEHSWATLSRSFDDGIYYLTIDCRYPLPPHKPNVGCIITRDASSYNLVSYKESNRHLFLGPSAVIYDTNIDYYAPDDGGGTDLSLKPGGSGYLNSQEINVFDGVCFRDDLSTTFSMLSTDTVKGQDYISRAVSFVDIVIHKDELDQGGQAIKFNDDTNYKSATKKVRPKNGKHDLNSWYVCWGFDFLDLEGNISNKIIDFVDISKYRYAFHYNDKKEFIYQIYKIGDSSFRSGFAFLKVHNRPSYDNFGHISFCVNCDPEVYKNKSINNNSAGNEIDLVLNSSIQSKDSFIENKKQVNTFFNTCYRNYNFSDGINVIRGGSNAKGSSGKISQPSSLPTFAPTKPSHSCLFSENKSFISCSFNSIPGQELFLSDGATVNLYEGSDTNLVLLPTFESPNTTNLIRYKNNEYKYVIEPDMNLNTLYPVFIESDGFRKLVIDTNAQPMQKTLADVISSFGNDSFVSKSVKKDSIDKIFITLDQESVRSTKEVIFSNFFNPNFIYDTTDYSILLPISALLTPNIFNGLAFGTRKGASTSLTGRIPSEQLANTAALLNNVSTNSIQNDSFWKNYIYGMGTIAPTMLKANTTTNPLEPPVRCYIKIPLKDLYSKISEDKVNKVQNFGNFNFNFNTSYNAAQDYGINFFSVFKSCKIGLENSQEPLVASIYTFSNYIDQTSQNSIFGTSNKQIDSAKNYIPDKDSKNKYSELPIFLFSAAEDTGKFKGILQDLSLAPSSIQDGVVVVSSDGSGTTYKKVFWGGMWFPWNANKPPSFNGGE